jgi:hypothetical protein
MFMDLPLMSRRWTIRGTPIQIDLVIQPTSLQMERLQLVSPHPSYPLLLQITHPISDSVTDILFLALGNHSAI